MSIGPQAIVPQLERAWLAELLSDSREVVVRLLEEPRHSVDELRAQVAGRMARLREATGISSDAEVAEALGQGALELLDRCADRDAAFHQLAQVAIRYFVLDEDGDGDLNPVFGFDDDVEVFNVVTDLLGLPELAIDAG